MTTNKTVVLQDVFLNQVRKERTAVTIYLTNGFQLRGLVKGFDNFTVILDSDGKQMLIYKHAISTITPAKNMNFGPNHNTAVASANNLSAAVQSGERTE